MMNRIEEDQLKTRCTKCKRVFNAEDDPVRLCPYCGGQTKEIVPRKYKSEEDVWDDFKG